MGGCVGWHSREAHEGLELYDTIFYEARLDIRGLPKSKIALTHKVFVLTRGHIFIMHCLFSECEG